MQNNKLNLSIISFNRCQSFSLSCAQELFVNNIASRELWYSAKIIEWDDFDPDIESELMNSNTIVLLDVELETIKMQSALMHLIIDFYKRGSRLVSFGSGVLLLALAGLLNGKCAAVDSRHVDEYSAKFPQVNFRADLPFSEEEQIYCSASSVSALRLGIRIISEDLENDVAIKVANILQLTPYQADLQNRPYANINRLSEVLNWAENNLEQISNLDQLAQRCYMSRRNFDRQFRTIYDKSPKAWLTEKRIALAINYLRNGSMAIEDIASAAGFSSAVNFRNNFKNYLGISPSEFRSNIV